MCSNLHEELITIGLQRKRMWSAICNLHRRDKLKMRGSWITELPEHFLTPQMMLKKEILLQSFAILLLEQPGYILHYGGSVGGGAQDIVHRKGPHLYAAIYWFTRVIQTVSFLIYMLISGVKCCVKYFNKSLWVVSYATALHLWSVLL